MTGIKKITFPDNIPPVNIIDSTSFTVREKNVLHATSSLSLNDDLFVPDFSVSLLFISELTT